MSKKFLYVLIICILCINSIAPVSASENAAETETAGAFLQERGIYQGDGTGSLKLGSGLTRAELAAILTRLHGEGSVDPEHYTWACYFEDVPKWGKPYIGYCTATRLMNGYNSQNFGPNDKVSPAMACTVVLRCCGHENSEGSKWTYANACNYAAELGLISRSTADESYITRGEMAVLIRRAVLRREDPSSLPSAPVENAGGGYAQASDGSLLISSESWSSRDFSQDADPAVFKGVYSRELYNAVRQTLENGGEERLPAYTMVHKGDDYSAAVNVIGRMNGLVRYKHYVPENLSNYWQYLDYFAVSAEIPENYEAPLKFIQPVIAETQQMKSDSEKVEYLNDYLGTLLDYERNSTAGIAKIFSAHDTELKAACGSYTEAFKFLCGAADIPCFSVRTEIHSWNMVYADGEWLYVDTSLNDLTSSHTMLLRDSYPNHPDKEPDATAFIKELLVPGSSKF